MEEVWIGMRLGPAMTNVTAAHLCLPTVVMVTQTAIPFKTLHLPGGNGSSWSEFATIRHIQYPRNQGSR